MKIKVIAFISIIILSCKSKEEITKSNLLNGEWDTNQWDYAHKLVIDKNGIFVFNNIDSVFNLSYKIKKNTIITWNTDNKRFKRKILKLNDSIFEIEGFHEDSNIKKYTKEKLILNNLR